MIKDFIEKHLLLKQSVWKMSRIWSSNWNDGKEFAMSWSSVLTNVHEQWPIYTSEKLW